MIRILSFPLEDELLCISKCKKQLVGPWRHQGVKSSYNKYFFLIFLKLLKAGSQLFRISSSGVPFIICCCRISLPESRLSDVGVKKNLSFCGNNLYACSIHFNCILLLTCLST